MMDYYSNFTNSMAPSITDCKKEVKDYYTKNNKYILKYINEEKLKNIINDVFINNDLIQNNVVDCSLTGWNVYGKDKILQNVSTKILFYLLEKKKKFKRTIRGLLKSSYLLIKCYKQSKEKMYEPNSDFMKEIYSKYNLETPQLS